MNIQSTVKRITAIIVGTIFITAAYYLPADSFMSFFRAGLFLIPTAFFVYMIQKMAKGDDSVQTVR